MSGELSVDLVQESRFAYTVYARVSNLFDHLVQVACILVVHFIFDNAAARLGRVITDKSRIGLLHLLWCQWGYFTRIHGHTF